MTIELDVIPVLPELFRWGELQRLILEFELDEKAKQLVGGSIGLFELRKKRPIDDAEVIGCPGYYYFELAQQSTLSMTIERNTPGPEDSDYVEDFARNLTTSQKQDVMRQWEISGYLATVSSYGGRAKGELKILGLIARCIARLANGFVVVKENGVFIQPVGVYGPDEFLGYQGTA